MSKRSSSDNSNCDSNLVEPKVKRRKNVEFESVRICSISGVVSFFIFCVLIKYFVQIKYLFLFIIK